MRSQFNTPSTYKEREIYQKPSRTALETKKRVFRSYLPKTTPYIKVVGLKGASHSKPSFLSKTHKNILPRGCDVRNFLSNPNLRKRSIEIAKLLNRKCSMKGFTAITTEEFRKQNTFVTGCRRTFYNHLKYLYVNHVICVIDDYYDPKTGSQRRIIVTAEHYHKALDFFNSVRDLEDPRLKCPVAQKVYKKIRDFFEKHPVVLSPSPLVKEPKNCTHIIYNISKEKKAENQPPAGPTECRTDKKTPRRETPNKAFTPLKTNKTKKTRYKLTKQDKILIDQLTKQQTQQTYSKDDMVRVTIAFQKTVPELASYLGNWLAEPASSL